MNERPLPKAIPVPDLKSCAEMIRYVRMTASMRQQDFARYLGIKPLSVSFYECGHRIPRIRTIKHMIDLASSYGLYLTSYDFKLPIRHRKSKDKVEQKQVPESVRAPTLK